MERGPPTCVSPSASTAPPEPSQKHVPGQGFALGKSGLALQAEKWVVLKIKGDALVLPWFSAWSPLPWARALSSAPQIAVLSANLLVLFSPLGLMRKRKKKKRKSSDGCSPGERFVCPGPAANHLCGCIEHQENVPIGVPLCFSVSQDAAFAASLWALQKRRTTGIWRGSQGVLGP